MQVRFPLGRLAVLVFALSSDLPQAQNLLDGELAVTSGELAWKLALQPGDELLSYGWDESVEIPWLGFERIVPIVWGECAATPATLLALRFQGAREITSDPRLALVQARDVRWTAGRHGRGLALGPSTRVVLGVASTAAAARDWTVDLRFRPTPFALGTTLLELAGALRVSIRSDGHLAVRLETPTAPGLVSTEPVTLGAWNHVALSLDGTLLEHLRFVLNGETQARALAGEPLPFGFTAVRLGDTNDVGAGFVGALDDLHLKLTSSVTAELLESGLEDPAAGPHRLTLRLASGVRTLDFWHEPFTGHALESEADWKQGRLVHATVEEGRLLRAEGNWTRLFAPDPPTSRTTHPTVFLGDGRVFTFGGETRDSHIWPMRNTNDTWIFDTRSALWRRVATSVAPSGRCHQPAAYSPDHDLVLYVGGLKNDEPEKEVFSDTWVYRVGSETWEERFPSGVDIGRQGDDGLIYHPPTRRFALFNGGEILIFDPTANHWSRRAPATAVSADGLPSAYTVPGSPMTGWDPASDQVLFFGGARVVGTDRIYVDTTVLYDVAANRHVVLDPPVRPSPRVRSGFAYDGNHGRFVLAGGVQDQFSEREDDLWSFDPERRTWREHRAANAPSARGGFYGMAFDPELDRFVLLCGRNSPTRFLNEAWSLRLDENATGRAFALFDRTSTGAGAFVLEAETSGTARVDVRFRTSRDGRAFGPWTTDPPGSERFVLAEVRLRRGAGGEEPAVTRLGFERP